MVWSRDNETERPPLSAILPRLYLGAERDVTQERLASLGISYVLSVSRCSPQPSFLPRSRYLRIPIDDSLWDDLLPWIPQALHFIDAAVSSGASVLVHCAAGISRSPALAVAYVMYSRGMDLDQAYRFVKERRPSISPNFNFLGQLQHFQATLSQKASGGGGGDLLVQQLDNRLPSVNDNARAARNMNDGVAGDSAEDRRARGEKIYHADQSQQRHSPSGGSGNQPWIVHLSLSQQDQVPGEDPAPSPREPVRPAAKPTQLQLPASSASLLEKRKSLTLSLTPLAQQARGAAASKTETGDRPEAKTQSASCRRAGVAHRESQSPSQGTEAREQGPPSPFSFTLNKLLGWGERVLLGGVFVHPVRMGQPALPYRC